MEDEHKSEHKSELKLKTSEKNNLSPVYVDYSANLKQYMAVQEVPNFGVQGYFAVSRKPIYNLDDKRTEDVLENIFDETNCQVFDEKYDQTDEYEYLDLSGLPNGRNKHGNSENVYFLAPKNDDIVTSQNNLLYDIDAKYSQKIAAVRLEKSISVENLVQQKFDGNTSNLSIQNQEKHINNSNSESSREVLTKDKTTFGKQFDENSSGSTEGLSFCKNETKIFTSETILNNVCSDLMIEMQNYLDSENFLSVEKMLGKEIGMIFGNLNKNHEKVNEVFNKNIEDYFSSSSTDFGYQSSISESDSDQFCVTNLNKPKENIGRCKKFINIFDENFEKHEKNYDEPIYNKHLFDPKENIKSNAKIRNIPAKEQRDKKIHISKSFPTSLFIEDNSSMQHVCCSKKNQKINVRPKERKPHCNGPRKCNTYAKYYNRDLQNDWKISHWLAEGDEVYYEMVPYEEINLIFPNDEMADLYFENKKRKSRTFSSRNCPLCLQPL